MSLFKPRQKNNVRLALPGALFVAGLLLFGFSTTALAKTFEFDGEEWEVPVAYTAYVKVWPIRNEELNLKAIAAATVIGKTAPEYRQVLDNVTLAELNKLASEVNQEKSEAKLVIENNRAIEFQPGNSGQSLDLYQTVVQLSDDSQSLPVMVTPPQTNLAQTNNLGINELIAAGESDFTGSPRNRVHNVSVGADKFNGLILAPGEEFSFNKYLGDVDGEHGFLPELVIKRTGVVPEFGGGLCQVSSTAFRAAMNAGLPITARRNHSFAVKYYAPQGTDATIYPGSQDLKFVNDTGNSILVRTKIVGSKLYFEYYGTKDNRQVSFDGPVQYDMKADGSLKATWTRHVTNNGETKTQTFNSTYLPPALFQPVTQAETPNPESPENTENPAEPTNPTT